MKMGDTQTTPISSAKAIALFMTKNHFHVAKYLRVWARIGEIGFVFLKGELGQGRLLVQ